MNLWIYARRPCNPLSSRMFFGHRSSMVAFGLAGWTLIPRRCTVPWICLSWPQMHILAGSSSVGAGVACWIQPEGVSSDLYFGITWLPNLQYRIPPYLQAFPWRLLPWLIGTLPSHFLGTTTWPDNKILSLVIEARSFLHHRDVIWSGRTWELVHEGQCLLAGYCIYKQMGQALFRSLKPI